MGRIIAIDYGTKRVGIAVTDPMKIIATGLTTVHSKDVIQYLKDYTIKEEVELFLVGIPKNLNNTDTDATKLTEDFVKHLGRTFPAIPVKTVDERFTSKMASHAILMSGAKKKDRQNKELVDMTSAVIILQSYMQ